MSRVLDIAALLGCALVIVVIAALITAAVAPRVVQVMAEDTTSDEPGPATVEVDDEPAPVEATPTLRELLTPPPTGPVVRLAVQHGNDGVAVQVGHNWVHRTCSDARRDGDQDRVCAYCAPRMAGVPTTGGAQ